MDCFSPLHPNCAIRPGWHRHDCDGSRCECERGSERNAGRANQQARTPSRVWIGCASVSSLGSGRLDSLEIASNRLDHALGSVVLTEP